MLILNWEDKQLNVHPKQLVPWCIITEDIHSYWKGCIIKKGQSVSEDDIDLLLQLWIKRIPIISLSSSDWKIRDMLEKVPLQIELMISNINLQDEKKIVKEDILDALLLFSKKDYYSIKSINSYVIPYLPWIIKKINNNTNFILAWNLIRKTKKLLYHSLDSMIMALKIWNVRWLDKESLILLGVSSLLHDIWDEVSNIIFKKEPIETKK